MNRSQRRVAWGVVLLLVGSANLTHGLVSRDWVSILLGLTLVVFALRRFEEAGL